MGFCVHHPDLAATVRGVVPPLQASSLSLGVAREILVLGDISERLRANVQVFRARMVELMGRLGVGDAAPANAHLPYVLVRDDPRAWFERLRKHGVQGKIHLGNARVIMRDLLHTAPAITDAVVSTVCSALHVPESTFPRDLPPVPLALFPDTLTALRALNQVAPVVTLSNVTCREADTDRLRALLRP